VEMDSGETEHGWQRKLDEAVRFSMPYYHLIVVKPVKEIRFLINLDCKISTGTLSVGIFHV